MESWVENMYIETSQLWKEIGSPKRGYAIFYSPIIINTELMIIGENPAGDDDFDESKVGVPDKHDYEIYNYKIAENMKKIFGFANITSDLFKSVKLNLNFFATKNTSILSEQEYFSKTENFSQGIGIRYCKINWNTPSIRCIWNLRRNKKGDRKTNIKRNEIIQLI